MLNATAAEKLKQEYASLAGMPVRHVGVAVRRYLIARSERVRPADQVIDYAIAVESMRKSGAAGIRERSLPASWEATTASVRKSKPNTKTSAGLANESSTTARFQQTSRTRLGLARVWFYAAFALACARRSGAVGEPDGRPWQRRIVLISPM